ncbi:lysylphosphatidylglycerol synthase transmembrane domain-containing protein [Salibacter sp.]|uniref:lysylphosphatidylglycerol synthase transmembrane domain-containing protein n=1 Tax=Salibacter sp. TaxID=2010995 RepID=UPI0028702D14|nr:lysylphosphatidylglycerol synthase transmembrane domain-containing protein [Salibacter sp.]MDR9397448.1 lysylphosphatidylglycerol synthase transmembrane domain-containing protein [Salibacter sp.]MDR9486682.1 lysylphosphatidylglycerol synthase transmembrane domain-containing protein [Salibacter sp.]
MKKYLTGFLKIAIPLGFGLFLVWYFYSSLTPEDKTEIMGAFERANYSWVWLSLVAATLSHMSRAYRWKFTLAPLGYKPNFTNSFFAVMIGYLINLAVPRLGEISRCGIARKYENIPFEKLLGTVIAERVADALILMTTILTVVFLQYEVIQGLLNDILASVFGKISGTTILVLLVVLLVGGIGSLVFIYRIKSENKLIQTIQKTLKGIVDGMLSIYTMKKKWAFIGHTIFIWLMYLMMFYLCFFALPETSDVPIAGVLTGFALGGITIAVTNGGIGAYPLAVQAILVLYEVDKNTAGAFGWIVWTAQTILILILGALSFALISPFNRWKNDKLKSTQA